VLAWRADRPRTILSFQGAAWGQAQERIYSPPRFRRSSRTEQPRASADRPVPGRRVAPPVPASGLQRNKRSARTTMHTGQDWTIASSFLLGFMFLQHGFHDAYLSALRVVGIGCEVEYLRVLSGARGVEQIFYHGQRAVVVLNHSHQE